MIVGVARQVNMGGGRFIARGAYVVGKGISKEDAERLLRNPRFAREIDQEQVARFGGFKLVESPFPPAGVAAPSAERPNDEAAPVDLSAPNEAIAEALSALTEAEREAAWDATEAEALAEFLVVRLGRDRKQWTHGQMVNMIEGSLEI